MPRQLWLADEFRAAGLDVLEVDGWRTRQTREGFDPLGIVWHDTVTGPTLSRTQEQGILRDGRADLAGPLSQTGLHRDGVVSIIAAGRCNHNGGGDDGHGHMTSPIWGNDAYGIEVFCYGGFTGHEEPYNLIQQEVASIMSAVICKHHGWTSGHVKGHKETDPTRKVDPFAIDMIRARDKVGQLLIPIPPPPPPPPILEPNMVLELVVPDTGMTDVPGGLFLFDTTGGMLLRIGGPADDPNNPADTENDASLPDAVEKWQVTAQTFQNIVNNPNTKKSL
jgi:hypothetical protein